MALAKWQFKRQRRRGADPTSYAIVLPDDPKYWFKFETVSRTALRDGRRAYWSANVEAVLDELGSYKYGDARSEQLLESLDF